MALNKPAEQSSDLNVRVFPASKAVNGITDEANDFSHTEPSDYLKWWKVDLEAKYSIGRIELYNRPAPVYCK